MMQMTLWLLTLITLWLILGAMNLADWLGAQRGRQAALAGHLCIKQPQVAAWVSQKRPIPLEHCPLIQAFTEGAVTCEELRPDRVEYFALIRAQAIDAATPAIRRSQETAFRDLPACVQKRVIGADSNKGRPAPAGGR
jgi:DNA-binding transcriptional regulator YdaS (Cro superfamily)